jgi:4-amino-4-deoxy-L-arabinose transferase-like glycosyltransferase
MRENPPDMTQGMERRREWMAPAAVLLAAGALRAGVLCTGQAALRSDEAVVGLMAKHIVTRGETPIFLYGQVYGGGHAVVAWIAAPLVALFGPSPVVLTGISAFFSLGCIALVWLIVRRYAGWGAALGATVLYAFAAPIIYQSGLVNGGTESFLLALLALMLFLRAYLEGRATPGNGFATGLLCGLAYYAMDYAVLYPVVFAALWLTRDAPGKWRYAGYAAVGLVAGCLPLALYNFATDFAHVRMMFAPAAGVQVGFLEHVFGALGGIFTGDLAAFYGGDIDDRHPAGVGAWAQAYAAIAAVVAVAWWRRAELRAWAQWRPFGERRDAAMPFAVVMLAFVAVYVAMYCVAKFSLPGLRTPRYFLPLCPFVPVLTALVLTAGEGWRKRAGFVVIAALALHGAATGLSVGMRPWHEEHGVRTSGREMAWLAAEVRRLEVHYAYAPYEIQFRLMYETDESVIVSCKGISPVFRYPPYDEAVAKAVQEGKPFAFIFRKDFAFAEWAAQRGLGLVSRERFLRACAATGVDPAGKPAGEEFVIYYPLDARFLAALEREIETAR